MKIRLAKTFALACTVLLALPAHAAYIYKLENLSYPVGQKTLTGLESGTIHQGLVVKVLRNGQPAANEMVRFHLSSAAGKNAEVSPLEDRTDKDGIVKATLKIGDAQGEYLVEAFHNGKLETPPVQIRTKALRRGWIAFLLLGLFGGACSLSLWHGGKFRGSTKSRWRQYADDSW